MQHCRDSGKRQWRVFIQTIQVETVMFASYERRKANELRKRCAHFLLSRSLTNEVNATMRSCAKPEALLMKFDLPVFRTDINTAKTNGIELASCAQVIRLLTILADAPLIQWIRGAPPGYIAFSRDTPL